MDNSALFKVGYGLYVLTTKDGDRDNGCIINTLLQVTNVSPFVGVITVIKQNFTHDMIMKSKKFNISILNTNTPFEVFKHFGFQSGRTVDKFSDYKNVKRSKNNIIYLPEYSNAYLSCEVTEIIDFGSHTMFKVRITDGEVISDIESVTYTYYQKHIKPQPKETQKNGYRCVICGYIYEGETLPTDFICPLCKHGASDFVKI
jgi:flavin reductase (DIM6/NTAB) family NADH-FMN oxidoreductase RutF